MQTGLKLEDLFLKIFKGTVLVLMTLALLAMVLLFASAAYESTKQPKEPDPPKKAVQKEVSLEDLKTHLLRDSQPRPSPATPQPTPNVPPSLRYLEEVTRLYRCSTDFATKVGAEIDETDNSVIAQRVEDLRSQVEKLAGEEDHRGEPWVKAAVKFTCAALSDPAIVAMRKDGKVKGVFFPVLSFHLQRWDAIEQEKAQFEAAEAERAARERAQEQLRIAQAKATAIAELAAAGISFAVFMALALYLILAKIENNLRNIDGSIRALRPTIAVQSNE